MTYSDEGKHETLKYRLAGLQEDAGLWGHEYVRHLAMEIGEEYNQHLEKDTEQPAYLLELALHIVPFFLQHNAEADAVDLLMELEAIDRLPAHIDKNTYKRVCLYMLRWALTTAAEVVHETRRIDQRSRMRVRLVPLPNEAASTISSRQTINSFCELFGPSTATTTTLHVSIKLGDHALIEDDLNSCPDMLLQKQLAFMLARQRITVETAVEELNEILNNGKISEHFLSLARELDVMEAKTPEDIYKTHLENTRIVSSCPSFLLSGNLCQRRNQQLIFRNVSFFDAGPGFVSGTVDSARQNLASTFVNAFVNAAFGTDKLMTGGGETTGTWIYKNKDHGMMSAAASLGMILLWDVEVALTQIDKYLYSDEEFIKAGALMAIGIVNSGVHNESDPAIALLSEYIESKSDLFRTGAILGYAIGFFELRTVIVCLGTNSLATPLGMAYAATGREDISELLSPIVTDVNLSFELSCFAALALGNVFAGTGNGEVASAILQTMMERTETQLKETYARFLALGLALVFIGRQEQADVTLETLKVIEHHVARQAEVMVEMCAYAGTYRSASS
ncbi:MAG: hypothetical protein BJ554DRAFT_7255 [Olpidium bornovanus]|uniref:RPN1 N-terminal domain-containing protein n=1 Tax=Olpidium bornovanus TaxID=278681 RepID=A0A8H8A1M5_9FUNG|nr:MAG: hypothetical protein BJ554DRAFT_7255 [Olpidium bornovanus]